MSTAHKWTPLAVRLLAALLTPPLTLAQNGCEISSPALWPLSVGEEKEPSSAGQSLAEHIRNLLVRRLDRPIDPKAKPLPGSRIVLAVRSANTLVGYLIFSYDALPPAVAEAPIRHAWNLVTQGQLPFPFSGRMLSELEWMDCTRCAVWNCLLLQRSSPIHPNTLKWCDPRYERQGQDGRHYRSSSPLYLPATTGFDQIVAQPSTAKSAIQRLVGLTEQDGLGNPGEPLLFLLLSITAQPTNEGSPQHSGDSHWLVLQRNSRQGSFTLHKNGSFDDSRLKGLADELIRSSLSCLMRAGIAIAHSHPGVSPPFVCAVQQPYSLIQSDMTYAESAFWMTELEVWDFRNAAGSKSVAHLRNLLRRDTIERVITSLSPPFCSPRPGHYTHIAYLPGPAMDSALILQPIVSNGSPTVKVKMAICLGTVSDLKSAMEPFDNHLFRNLLRAAVLTLRQHGSSFSLLPSTSYTIAVSNEIAQCNKRKFILRWITEADAWVFTSKAALGLGHLSRFSHPVVSLTPGCAHPPTDAHRSIGVFLVSSEAPHDLHPSMIFHKSPDEVDTNGIVTKNGQLSLDLSRETSVNFGQFEVAIQCALAELRDIGWLSELSVGGLSIHVQKKDRGGQITVHADRVADQWPLFQLDFSDPSATAHIEVIGLPVSGLPSALVWPLSTAALRHLKAEHRNSTIFVRRYKARWSPKYCSQLDSGLWQDSDEIGSVFVGEHHHY